MKPRVQLRKMAPPPKPDRDALWATLALLALAVVLIGGLFVLKHFV